MNIEEDKLDGTNIGATSSDNSSNQPKQSNISEENIAQQDNINRESSDNKNSTQNTASTKSVFKLSTSNLSRYLLVKMRIFFIRTGLFLSKNNKKIFTILSLVILLSVAGVVGYSIYDFSRIAWNDNSDDGVNFTQPTSLTFGVVSYDKDNNATNKVSWKVSGGTLNIQQGKDVIWELPKKDAEYTITASLENGKKISKKITVFTANYINPSTNISEADSDADNDKDGLINSLELTNKTNMNLPDTDSDGITDNCELNITKTDPLKADTDGDTISDGDELDLGLNPLKIDSKDDGVSDGDRTLTYMVENIKLGITVDIVGKGNIASTTIDNISNNSYDDIDGVLSDLYDFYSSGTIEKATIKIKYDKEAVAESGSNEKELSIYYFNEDEKKFEKIPSTVDEENSLIIAEVNHFSKYIIADSSKMVLDPVTDIMFVIDNSGSMFPKSIGGQDSDENDVDFKRVDLTLELIDKLDGNFRFGAGKFTYEYSLLANMIDNKTIVKNAVKNIKTQNENFSGTYIGNALSGGLDQFSNTQSSKRRYVVLLTDGVDTTGNLFYDSSLIDEAIEEANAKDVKVLVIGLGNNIDRNFLAKIATETGGEYYHASSVGILDEIYKKISQEINYNYIDTDGDDINDGIVLADSGFVTERDGFSFSNFTTNINDGGHCYGMAYFSKLYFQDMLPLRMGDITVKKSLGHIAGSLSVAPEQAVGYDLSEVEHIVSDKPLYDYKLSDLKAYDIPAKSMYDPEPVDGVLVIKEENRKILEAEGFEIKKVKYDGSSKFEYYEDYSIDLSSENYKNNIDVDQQEIIKAIYRLYVLQVSADNDKSSFTTDPDESFVRLFEGLDSGEPLITSIDGNHAINATKLIRDIKDPNLLKIEIYDNNYPGETRYIEMHRSQTSNWQWNWEAWSHDYQYEFEYDGSSVNGVSLSFPVLQ